VVKPRFKQKQSGFTLVELAIVMIVISLLIAGVLKGQQLVNNAKIVSTVAQIKAIDAATTSFQDQYDGLPGDLLNAGQRIAGCAAMGCATGNPGNGDGKVNLPSSNILSVDFSQFLNDETIYFWLHLAAANLMPQFLVQDYTMPAATLWGHPRPPATIGGGFDVGYYAGGTGLSKITGTTVPVPAGHYLALHGVALVPPVGGTAADSFLTPGQAAQLDTKFDDGNPNMGNVRAAAFNANSCVTDATASATYLENLSAPGCSLYIKIRN
jgi:prepilin-type N-terminal cleavage/methylation domain-containing protein